MNATATRTQDIPKLRHDEAMRLARTDRDKLVAELKALDTQDWTKPTDCDRWNVKDVIAHLIGMCNDLQTVRKLMAAQKAGKSVAKEEGLKAFDGWTELQVRTSRHLSPADTISTYEEASERLLRRRDTANALLRQVRMPQPPFGLWSVGYMMDDILTRDTWMHRADIAKATGKPMNLTADHDGRFVANIVAELAKRWKKPFTLELTGPAGGSYVNGEGGQTFSLDAVDFCRILSGRGDASHPLHNVVPF
jgi:uncharacterized protein (TIGR03083 family)